MPCRCEDPTPYIRPSGLVICNACGGRLERKTEKKIQP